MTEFSRLSADRFEIRGPGSKWGRWLAAGALVCGVVLPCIDIRWLVESTAAAAAFLGIGLMASVSKITTFDRGSNELTYERAVLGLFRNLKRVRLDACASIDITRADVEDSETYQVTVDSLAHGNWKLAMLRNRESAQKLHDVMKELLQDRVSVRLDG
jgi:hypothetical protein